MDDTAYSSLSFSPLSVVLDSTGSLLIVLMPEFACLKDHSSMDEKSCRSKKELKSKPMVSEMHADADGINTRKQ